MAMPTAVAWLILVAILAQGVQSEVEDLCNVNDQAYVDYKILGAKETALLEINRH